MAQHRTMLKVKDNARSWWRRDKGVRGAGEEGIKMEEGIMLGGGDKAGEEVIRLGRRG